MTAEVVTEWNFCAFPVLRNRGMVLRLPFGIVRALSESQGWMKERALQFGGGDPRIRWLRR